MNGEILGENARDGGTEPKVQTPAGAAAAKRQELLDRAQQKESAQAARFLAQFVAEAKLRGLPTTTLALKAPATGRQVKTTLTGWYLKEDSTLAVDTDGQFYILSRPLTLLDVACGRLRPPTPKPTAPPLILSKGGRDGESMDLTAKLDALLETWRNGGQQPR